MSDFAVKMQLRTKQLAIRVFRFFKKRKEVDRVIRYQLSKSISSAAANYVACRTARSKKEYYSKLCIVLEETSESAFWLSFLLELEPDLKKEGLEEMHAEALELSKIFATSRTTVKNKMDRKKYLDS